MGCAQVERLSEFLAAKKRVRQTYDAAFANHPRVTLFPNVPWADSAHWFSGVVLREDSGLILDSLVHSLRDAGIMARKFWKPMHLQTPYVDALKRPTGFTDALWERVLTLPCSTSLTAADQSRVITTLQKFLG